MKNVFIVNTPFQLYVVRCIIRQHFEGNDNIILSTIKSKEYDDAYCVPHGIKGVLIGRRIINKLKKEINKEAFFIPHMGNLFASFFFDLSVNNDRPISVYYEGAALFYDPIVSNIKAKRRRIVNSLLLGIRYHHYEQLYPPCLLEKAINCYSPIESPLLNKYKNVITFKFNKINRNGSSNILFLTSDTANDSEIQLCVKSIEQYVINDPVNRQILYIKPHYSLATDIINQFYNATNNLNGINVVVLDKTTPIEELYENIDFKYVVCQRFTSAIINIFFIWGNEIKCVVVDKNSIPQAIVNDLGITIQ